MNRSAALASDASVAAIHPFRFEASDAELAELYGRARAFAFLSEYEGLGLTPLEALSAGVPSLVLDTAVARESCGPSALYVERADREQVALGLERLLYDERLRGDLLSHAGATLARFDWTSAAQQTLQVLEDAS